jgi:hypothetical protein
LLEINHKSKVKAMNIQFLEPFSKGWERMKQALFKPFDLKKWFVVGFTAFLANLTDYGGGSNYRGAGEHEFNWDDIIYFPQNAWEWLQENPGWFTLIIMALVLFIILIIFFFWLSSRGKFMFLDNVVHNQAQVVNPWREFKIQGDSLFTWRLVFGLLVFTIFISYLVNCYSYLYDLYTINGDESVLLSPLIWMIIGLVALFIIVGFIDLLLSDFIVPLMYKHRIKTNEAWSRFLPLLYSHFWYFLGYAILIFFIAILVIVGVIFAGLLTCCLGFLFLIIPYISSVVLLPVSYTLRAFSVEFLEQFGSDFQIFPRT